LIDLSELAKKYQGNGSGAAYVTP